LKPKRVNATDEGYIASNSDNNVDILKNKPKLVIRKDSEIEKLSQSSSENDFNVSKVVFGAQDDKDLWENLERKQQRYSTDSEEDAKLAKGSQKEGGMTIEQFLGNGVPKTDRETK